MCVNYHYYMCKLDGQGRARREAASRRKSEWKVNVAIPNSSRSNGSWQVTPTRKLCYRKVDRAMRPIHGSLKIFGTP